MSGVYGLDFGAITAMATGMGAMSPLLAELLPAIEQVRIASLRDPDSDLDHDAGDGGGDGDGG